MILIAIGGNLTGPDGAPPRENCERALAVLRREGIEILARSRWYRSAAWPPSDQPDYVNGVIRVQSEGPPEALLRRLHDIEAEMGRVRGTANMARVIDLDLLAFGDQIRGNRPHDGPKQLKLPIRACRSGPSCFFRCAMSLRIGPIRSPAKASRR